MSRLRGYRIAIAGVAAPSLSSVGAFVRLVEELGSISGTSRAVGRSLRSLAPADDILGSSRDARPDLGAFEAD